MQSTFSIKIPDIFTETNNPQNSHRNTKDPEKPSKLEINNNVTGITLSNFEIHCKVSVIKTGGTPMWTDQRNRLFKNLEINSNILGTLVHDKGDISNVEKVISADFLIDLQI